MDSDEVARLVSLEPTRARRISTFVALLGQKSGLGGKNLTVVGGSALEVYTEGEYVSGDIDIVTPDRGRLEETLREWGFRSEGMYWTSTMLPFVVQIVGREDSGSASRNRTISTSYGSVRLASVEDIIVKRLIETRHWNRPPAFVEAMLLVRKTAPTIDWDYVRLIAKRDGVLDLADEARRRAGNDADSGTDLRKE